MEEDDDPFAYDDDGDVEDDPFACDDDDEEEDPFACDEMDEDGEEKEDDPFAEDDDGEDPFDDAVDNDVYDAVDNDVYDTSSTKVIDIEEKDESEAYISTAPVSCKDYVLSVVKKHGRVLNSIYRRVVRERAEKIYKSRLDEFKMEDLHRRLDEPTQKERQVMDFASCSKQEAKQALEMCAGDVSNAINLFLQGILRSSNSSAVPVRHHDNAESLSLSLTHTHIHTHTRTQR